MTENNPENEPAINTAGYEFWTINGLEHRKMGAAEAFANGHKVWYYYGKWIDCRDQEEFERIIELFLFKTK